MFSRHTILESFDVCANVCVCSRCWGEVVKNVCRYPP